MGKVSRPPKPCQDAVWDRHSRKWLTPKDVRRMTLEAYGKIKDAGFQDVEYVSKEGRVSDEHMSGRQRSVDIHSFIKNSDGDLPEDFELFRYHESGKALLMEEVARLAREAVLCREPWDVCGAYAMAAAGYTTSAIARALGRSRNYTSGLLKTLNTKLWSRSF